jgi:uncharacterized protein (DUF2235 family)
MCRILVLCADGTCNAFGRTSSNVARLIEHLDLDRAAEQIACYDQGIGTRADQIEPITAFRERLRDREALQLLAAPGDSWSRPWTWPFLLGSMMFGWGLEANVRQLYVKLAELYEPGDTIFLFGFSRGAFTVRALAGLTWRYGIPVSGDAAEAERLFTSAWSLFRDEYPDEDGTKAGLALRFREQSKVRGCPIHFLGLWDTVKSYGGLIPVMLPHLRHNPSIAIVRHALALDEQRGWFDVTTWGALDSDTEPNAGMSRLDRSTLAALRTQDVAEVWFSGCHSDVGGGEQNTRTSDIALRWMLGEAANAGLELNAAGRNFLATPPAPDVPKPHDSHTAFWKCIEWIPRRAIDNGGRWPRRYWAKRGPAPRMPLTHSRGKSVLFHESVPERRRPGQIPEGVTLKTASTFKAIEEPSATFTPTTPRA